jgi:hypothetical protein
METVLEKEEEGILSEISGSHSNMKTAIKYLISHKQCDAPLPY